METLQQLLQTTRQQTLLSFGLAKRLLPETSLKTLKSTIKDAEAQGFLDAHNLPNLKCYSLTTQGFSSIGIRHSPSFNFDKADVEIILTVNHLTLGIEQALADYPIDIKIVRGSTFNRSPLSVRIRNMERKIKPKAAALLLDSPGLGKIYFIHHFENLESLNSDIRKYEKFQKANLHLHRFDLIEAPVRVLVVVPSYKTILEIKRYLQHSFYKQVLFIPASRCQTEAVLIKPVFMDRYGRKVSVTKNNYQVAC